MVVIVDEVANEPHEGLTDDLEDQLIALGEKWAHVCRFVEERSTVLELVARNWQLLEDEEVRFNQWISKLDKRLSEMEESAAETELGSQFVAELIKRLQRMEKEMETQHVHYSKIADEGQQLLDQLDKGSMASVEVGRKLERLTEIWDSTVQRMENLGVALTQAASIKSDKSQPSTPSKADQAKPSSPGTPKSGSGGKKRKLDTWQVKEWQHALENISVWLGRIESDLGLDEQEESSVIWDHLSIEEQQLLLDDTDSAILNRGSEVDDLILQGTNIVADLDSRKCLFQFLRC